MVEKMRFMPVVYISHDEEEYLIIIELPGMIKENIKKFEMNDSGFCLNAPMENLEYSGCWSLAHKVDPDKAKAKFKNGLLTVTVPLTGKFSGKEITIE